MKLKIREEGITLIALVITIIVLLILAGVTIAMLIGDNGLLTKVVSAKEKTEIGREKDFISLSATQAIAEDENHKLRYVSFDSALNSTIKNSTGRDYDLTPKKNSDEYKIKYLDTNRCYRVTSKGVIEEITNEEFEASVTTKSSKIPVKITANSVNEYNGNLQGEVYLSLVGQDSSNNSIWEDTEKVKITTPGESTNNLKIDVPKEVTKIKIAPIYAVSGTVTGDEQEVSVDSETLTVNYTFEASEDATISNSATALYAE